MFEQINFLPNLMEEGAFIVSGSSCSFWPAPVTYTWRQQTRILVACEKKLENIFFPRLPQFENIWINSQIFSILCQPPIKWFCSPDIALSSDPTICSGYSAFHIPTEFNLCKFCSSLASATKASEGLVNVLRMSLGMSVVVSDALWMHCARMCPGCWCLGSAKGVFCVVSRGIYLVVGCTRY